MPASLRQAAENPAQLGVILEFLLANEDLLLRFCENTSAAPKDVHAARWRLEEALMRLGIDLGGSKTEVIVLDDAGGECFRRRIASPQGDYHATVESIAGLVAVAESRIGTKISAKPSIGVAIPGTLGGEGLVKNANSTWLNGQPLGASGPSPPRLGRDVRLANDANCFALSEATDGAAQGCEVVFGVILGTGVGGGIVVRWARAGRRPRHRRRMGPQSPCPA